MSEDTKGTGVADAGAAAGSATAGGASGSSGQVGVGSASQESASKVFEGSTKQNTDIGAEEVASIIQNFDQEQLNSMIALASKGIDDLFVAQQTALEAS